MSECSTQHATHSTQSRQRRVRTKRSQKHSASGTKAVNRTCSQSGEWKRKGVNANAIPAATAGATPPVCSRAYTNAAVAPRAYEARRSEERRVGEGRREGEA